MTKTALTALRQQQDETEAIADELRAEAGEEHWTALIAFNTYHSMCFDIALEFFRTGEGKPACAFVSRRP